MTIQDGYFDADRWRQFTCETVHSFENFPEEALDFRPEFPDAWTIREHIIHLAESEMNAFLRLKAILAQPGSTAFCIDEVSWVKKLDYDREDWKSYLKLFEMIRELESQLLQTAFKTLHKYEDHSIEIPGYGCMRLIDWLDVYGETHIIKHRNYVERNLKQKRPSNLKVDHQAADVNQR